MPYENEPGLCNFCISLGDPKVRLGHLYTVQVHAVNGRGPGDWSDPVVFRFKECPPNRPCKPTLSIQSSSEILVTINRPPEKDENGSPITCCIVEYTKMAGNNACGWKVFKAPIKKWDEDVFKVSIRALTPDTNYYVRVKMANAAGESEPSEKGEASTDLIPGPPQLVHVGRKSKMLELHWKAPLENPEAVDKYVAQIRRAISKTSEWQEMSTVRRDILSAKATGLKADTMYKFRVCAVNKKSRAGEYSEEVDFVFGHVVAATAATILLGDPIVKRGIMAYKWVANVSPQTSDDERED